MAKALAARVGVVLTLGTLPGPSDAHTLTIYPDVPVMKMFDFIDPYLLVIIFCVWVITSYLFIAGVAYLLGRMSSTTGAIGVATMRPQLRPAVSDFPSSEAAIFTTRYGTYWHRTRECTFLETSSQVLVREPCIACMRRPVQPRAEGVTETPPEASEAAQHVWPQFWM